MTFAKPSTVSTSEIYWFDDTGRGGVRVPGVLAVALQVRRPVAAGRERRAYGVARNAWNTVSVHAGHDAALRIELAMQPGFSAGLQELKVR